MANRIWLMFKMFLRRFLFCSTVIMKSFLYAVHLAHGMLNKVFIIIRHINTYAAVQDDLDEGKIGSNRSYSRNSMGTVGAAHPQSTEAALEYIVVTFVWKKALPM